MSIELSPTRLPQPITELLGALRLRFRAYLWIEGLALTIAWLGLAFWISLALDWSVEPPAAVRLAMSLVMAAGVVFLLARTIRRNATARLGDTNLALLLERRFRRFRDSLVTTVELTEQPKHAAGFNPEMLDHTRNLALAELPDVRVADVFRNRPLVNKALGAFVLAGTVVLFAALVPDAFGMWAQRVLLLSDERWPRNTDLSVEGFADGRIKVAKGSDLEIIALADTTPPLIVPETLEVRYRTEEGTRGRENMSRLGVAGDDEQYQRFSYVFKGILSSRTFDVVGGDDRERDLHIDVVDSPTIADMTLFAEYPAYMQRTPRELRVTGLMQLPAGTKVRVAATANKPLAEVQVHLLRGEESSPLVKLDLSSAADSQRFAFQMDELMEDETLLISLLDIDGIRSREPVRLILVATPDEPPKLAVRLRGIGTAVTPQARLPVVGELTDDYGLARLWFEYQIDGNPLAEQPLETNPANRQSLALSDEDDEALVVEPLELTIGQKLTVAVKAADNCALASGANIGAGQQYQLDVVSPADLLSMLEARELMLRQRFEQLIQETTDLRDSVAEVDFIAAAAQPTPTNGVPTRGFEPEDVLKNEPDEPATSDSDEKAEPGSDEVAVRNAMLRQLTVERAIQNVDHAANDTRSLAIGFDDIREEMINNRIDTPELQTRLKDQIADPLHRIGDEMFAELDGRLRELQKSLTDADGSAKRDAAVEQADAILVEMRIVLERMLELESFNEVVEKLRSILQAQQKLREQTQQKQKDSLRDLEEE